MTTHSTSTPEAVPPDVLERVDQVVAEVVAPDAERVDREAAWPEQSLRSLQRARLSGLVAPVSAGGLGGGMLGLVQVCERIARACPSTALCFGMHSVATATIAARHTPEQREKFLDPIIRGEHLTTLALSEPGTGSSFWIPETQLERSDGAYRLTGRKTFVTNGSYADSYLISTVAAESDAPPGMFSCVMVPNDIEGVEWGEPWSGLGMRGNSSLSMSLKNVQVPAENLLGERGDQIWYVFHIIAPYFLMAMTGTYLGIAAGAVEVVRQHLMQREHAHTGRLLAQQPVLQHRLGQLWAEVERTRRLAQYAAAAGDAGEKAALPALLSAKAEVADCAIHVTNEAMTLAGGIAYRQNSQLARMLRDARASAVMAPTTDVLRTWVGRTLLEQPLISG